MEWNISGFHSEHITYPVPELPLQNSIRHEDRKTNKMQQLDVYY